MKTAPQQCQTSQGSLKEALQIVFGGKISCNETEVFQVCVCECVCVYQSEC